MSHESTRARVRQLIGEMSPNGRQEAASTDRLIEDLGYDSLAVIELSLQMESTFALTAIGQGTVPDITTVRDVEDLVVQSLLTAAGSA